ncbi:MAG TPA: hypothetical protein VFR90_01260 [Methylibium sp.]|uniref:hypothetical protein n=1 Tax=Methylibium sp. TaxID=2067992 RepID=UPI002DBBB292|nr:hypothetical protein [Methylibium sp.]HEU4457735.1 hypothetical protein [Methylibium sp.]
MPKRLLLCCSILSLLSIAQAADPASKPAAKKGNVLSVGGGKPGGKLLTRDQLRGCLVSQKELEQRDGEAAKLQTAIEADKAAIGQLDAALAQQTGELEAERAKVVMTDAASVDAYNAKLLQRREREEERNRKVDAYNAKLAPFNAQVQALKQSRDVWQADCADRPYDEADYFAIQRGK